MKPILYAAAFLSSSAIPAFAAAPPFETTAPVAYLVDLSSRTVLYAKDADRRMPPASMAKMMTTHIVFDMIKKGELKLDQKFTVRPETWQKWHGPQAGSTMFLSPGEQVSVSPSRGVLGDSVADASTGAVLATVTLAERDAPETVPSFGVTTHATTSPPRKVPARVLAEPAATPLTVHA